MNTKQIMKLINANKQTIVENVDYDVPKSITGLITNNKDKQQFPLFIQPFIYDNVIEEQYCIKLVIKNVDINENYIDNVMQHVYQSHMDDNLENKEDEKQVVDAAEKINTPNNNTNNITMPDKFDIEIMLSAFQVTYKDYDVINKIIEYVSKIKIFSIENKYNATLSINIGDPETSTNNIIPIIEFLLHINKLKNDEYKQMDKDSISYILRAFGPDAKFKMYVFESSTLHISGIPETLPINDRSHLKLAYVISKIMGISIDPNHVERPIGKLYDTTKNRFLPAPNCYVYITQTITADNCNEFNEKQIGHGPNYILLYHRFNEF